MSKNPMCRWVFTAISRWEGEHDEELTFIAYGTTEKEARAFIKWELDKIRQSGHTLHNISIFTKETMYEMPVL